MFFIGISLAIPFQTTLLRDSTRIFLENSQKVLTDLGNKLAEAEWNYEINITRFNSEIVVENTLIFNNALQEILNDVDRYTGHDSTQKRMLNILKQSGGAPKSVEKQMELSSVLSELSTLYSTATVDGKQLEPDLTRILASSRNSSALKEAYIGWRDATGPKMIDFFEKYVQLMNIGANDYGFKDTAEMWTSIYDMKRSEFQAMVENSWQQVLPLYKKLHCYAKYKLQKFYGDQTVDLENGLIPAHLLGNMWSQDWSNIYDILVPYSNATQIEITPSLIEKGYDAIKMHRVSEEFYTSLGYPPLPDSFWNKSMLTRPKNRQVVCHASAWDFSNDDLRIKMCTDITGEDLLVIHHEQGHLYYDHHYKDQPQLFRDAAADFFHEAIGDTIQLSVVVPSHLEKIGLIKKIEKSHEQTVNAQMAVALSKIPILAFSYIVDLWRWDVFSGNTKPENYQSSWIKLVEKYQGLKRPVDSTKNDFDPGAKFHVAANVPYIRYFGAAIIQFQFYEGLCKTIKHKGPLHECDFYRNKEAGKQFAKMLSMGKSKPWPEAVKVATGGLYNTLDGTSMKRYFSVLEEWLDKENSGKNCEWQQS